MLSEKERYELTPQQIAERRERFQNYEENTTSGVRSSIFAGEANGKSVAAKSTKQQQAPIAVVNELPSGENAQEKPALAIDAQPERKIEESEYVPSSPKELVKETPTFVSQIKAHDEQFAGPQAKERRMNARAEMAYRSSKETFEMKPLAEERAEFKTTNTLQSHQEVFKPELCDRRFPEREEFTMQIRSGTHPDVIERELKASGRVPKQLGASSTFK